MEGLIIEKLKQLGKITDADISEALNTIPTEIETEIIKSIWNYYSDDPCIDPEEELNLWVSHFLPILKEESFKIMQKVRDQSIIYEPPDNLDLSQESNH